MFLLTLPLVSLLAVVGRLGLLKESARIKLPKILLRLNSRPVFSLKSIQLSDSWTLWFLNKRNMIVKIYF